MFSKNQGIKQFLVILLGCFLLASCTFNNGTIMTPTVSPAASAPRAIEITPSQTLTPRTPTPFPTHIPTLEAGLARQRVAELFENNNGCRLPCWWGLTPGETTWADALSILAPISLKIDPYYPRIPSGSVYANIIPPIPDVYGSYLQQYYVVEDNIVSEIALFYNFDFAKFTNFKPFIREYGRPEQAYIHGYGEPQLDTWPFQIALFYPRQGMLLEYSGSPTIQGENLVVCWGEDHFPVAIHLWKPSANLTFEDVIAKYYDPSSTDLPPYRPIDKVVIDPNHFYDGLDDPQKKLCLKTPQSTWLTQR